MRFERIQEQSDEESPSLAARIEETNKIMTQQHPNQGSKKIFHLLPNAHLDPVWLWDWREGLGEGQTTVRTVLDLMEEFPELTFFRGESAIYEHIEKVDPATFRRIEQMVDSGRWDVVGGTYVQPDSNLVSAEALCRQFEVGLKYFSERFGRRPRVAWQADSFGHTPGFPDVLSAFGMEGFAFTRPQRAQFPMDSPAFWWQGRGKRKVLCYRQHWLWYCSERFNLPHVLDETLRLCAAHPHANVGVLMGLGNHGGGPSRRHILDAREWAGLHPEVEVRFSTLHRFFDVLREEVPGLPEGAVPVHDGDLGFCLRGCYSSALRLKSAHRASENALAMAETTAAAMDAGLGAPYAESLTPEWKAVLFNSFHDILPGSSIERALDDQIALAGSVVRRSQEVSFDALTRLAMEVDTSVPLPVASDAPRDVPLLVWNPSPVVFRGWMELEASLDYRPFHGCSADVGSMPLVLEGPDGEKPPFQEIATEHHSMRNAAWRKRVVFHSEVPALGWKVFRIGSRATEARPEQDPECIGEAGPQPAIRNARWRVELTPERRIKILREGKPFLGGDGAMDLATVEDIWGSWGGMEEENNAILTDKVTSRWAVSEAVVIEHGPERAALWTRWTGGKSWVDLTFYLTRDGDEIRVSGRMLWNERSSRLKLVLPSSGPLEMQVPAGVAARPQAGHLPCGRWVRRGEGPGSFGFVSDVFSDVDAAADALHVTLVRASRYADDVPTPANVRPWAPAMDLGEFKFRFLLVPGTTDLERLTGNLLNPPVVLCVAPHAGRLPDQGTFGLIEPSHAVLLALRHDGGGAFSVRIQNFSDAETDVVFTLAGQQFPLGVFRPWEIRTSELARVEGKLAAAVTNGAEGVHDKQ